MSLVFKPQKRKVLSGLCHGAILFSTVLVFFSVPLAIALMGIPSVIFFTTHDSIVKENAKESLNFYFNMLAYGALCGVLILLLIGIPLLVLLGFASLGMSINALAKIWEDPEQPYRYPWIFRWI